MKSWMKKVFVVLMLMILATPAFAETYSWDDKLARGVVNMVTSPVEIPNQIQIKTEEVDALNGWTVGLVKGLAHTLVRFGVGGIEVLTFPFDFPNEGKSPILQPEYAWEKKA